MPSDRYYPVGFVGEAPDRLKSRLESLVQQLDLIADDLRSRRYDNIRPQLPPDVTGVLTQRRYALVKRAAESLCKNAIAVAEAAVLAENAVTPAVTVMKSYDDPAGYLADAAPEIKRYAEELERTLEQHKDILPGSIGLPSGRQGLRTLQGTAGAIAYMSHIISGAAAMISRAAEAAAAVTPAVTRLCGCGCGQPVTSARPEARYASPACRVRAHRARATVSPAPARHRGQIP